MIEPEPEALAITKLNLSASDLKHPPAALAELAFLPNRLPIPSV